MQLGLVSEIFSQRKGVSQMRGQQVQRLYVFVLTGGWYDSITWCTFVHCQKSFHTVYKVATPINMSWAVLQPWTYLDTPPRCCMRERKCEHSSSLSEAFTVSEWAWRWRFMRHATGAASMCCKQNIVISAALFASRRHNDAKCARLFYGNWGFLYYDFCNNVISLEFHSLK